MRTFNSNIFNYNLLSLVKKKGPLTADEIITFLADKYNLSQEERNEMDPKENQRKFYHFVQNRLQSSSFKNDKKLKKWKITSDGKKRLNSFYETESLLLSIISQKLEFIDPELKHYEGSIRKKLGKNKNYLLCRKNDNLVLIFVGNELDEVNKILDAIKEDSNYENQTILSIVIKPFGKEKETQFDASQGMINSIKNVRIMYCHLDYFISNQKDDISPYPEDKYIPLKMSKEIKIQEGMVSDWLFDHLSSIEKGLRQYEKCREFPIDESHYIDLLCEDDNKNLVVIENKTIVEENRHIYDVVGQILCYIGIAKETIGAGKNIKGIILIPNNTATKNIDNIKYTLSGSKCCYDIKLMYYSTFLSFIDDTTAIPFQDN